jgi:hypothetical protein
MDEADKFYDHLVYFIHIWYFFGLVMNFMGIWYIFSHLGMLHEEKSGKPAFDIDLNHGKFKYIYLSYRDFSSTKNLFKN